MPKHISLWLSRMLTIGGVLGLIFGLLLTGIIGGIEIDRTRPEIRDASISSAASAGDNLVVHENIIVPDGCVPRITRILSKNRDARSAHNEVQLLTDAAVVANGDISIQVPRDTRPSDWFYEETVSTAGCGPMAGIIKPLSVEMRDLDGKIGVHVKVLPFDPSPHY